MPCINLITYLLTYLLMVTLCSWEGNRRSGIALALHYSLVVLTTYRLEAYKKRWASHLDSAGVWQLFSLSDGDLYLCCLQVIACHDYREGDEMKACSNRAIVSARTLPDSEF